MSLTTAEEHVPKLGRTHLSRRRLGRQEHDLHAAVSKAARRNDLALVEHEVGVLG